MHNESTRDRSSVQASHNKPKRFPRVTSTTSFRCGQSGSLHQLCLEKQRRADGGVLIDDTIFGAKGFAV